MQARTSSRVAVTVAALIGGIEGIILAVFREQIGHIFTSDPSVISLVATVLPIIALFQLSDAITAGCSGLLRGVGRSPVGAAVNISAYCEWTIYGLLLRLIFLLDIVGLPLGFALTFTKLQMGLLGLWIGLTAALAWVSDIQFIVRAHFGIRLPSSCPHTSSFISIGRQR